MNRYYVEFDSSVMGGGCYLYVMAYNPEHVRDMFPSYKLVAIDQTDQEDEMNIEYQYAVQDELNFDHEDSLLHWAALLADQECHDRDEAEWEMLYENFWMALDNESNYDLYQPQEDMMEDDLKYMLMKYLKEMADGGDYHAKNLLWMMEMDYGH